MRKIKEHSRLIIRPLATLVLMFATACQSTADKQLTASVSVNTEPTRYAIADASDYTVCNGAIEASHSSQVQWTTDAAFQLSVKEAKHRRLTPNTCAKKIYEQNMTEYDANRTNSYIPERTDESDFSICFGSLNWQGDELSKFWSDRESSESYIQEAKRRRLNPISCAKAMYKFSAYLNGKDIKYEDRRQHYENLYRMLPEGPHQTHNNPTSEHYALQLVRTHYNEAYVRDLILLLFSQSAKYKALVSKFGKQDVMQKLNSFGDNIREEYRTVWERRMVTAHLAVLSDEVIESIAKLGHKTPYFKRLHEKKEELRELVNRNSIGLFLNLLHEINQNMTSEFGPVKISTGKPS